jgi:hypothetical protein
MICQADLQVYQGDDYQGTVAVLDSSGNAVDLTGYTALAQIRIMPAQYWPYVAADITCSIGSPNNVVDLYIPAVVTATLYCTYVWDLQLTDSAGLVSTVLNGNVYVEQDITRAAGAQQRESDQAWLVKHDTPWRSRLQQIHAIVDVGSLPANPLGIVSLNARL